ncbi:hypothetical protein SSCG_01564 [Streptomyces clavuligerus]|nr:hypothetical protein SSCG_01564 [Streptomyces clavuligerus]
MDRRPRRRRSLLLRHPPLEGAAVRPLPDHLGALRGEAAHLRSWGSRAGAAGLLGRDP